MYEVTTIGALGDLPTAPAATSGDVSAGVVALAVGLGVVVGVAITLIAFKPKRRKR